MLPAFITKIIHFITRTFSAFMHSAALAAKNLNLTDELMAAAHDAVVAAETTGGTGADKFAAAIAIVQRDFAAFGIGAIQTAVQTAWGALLGGSSATPAQ